MKEKIEEFLGFPVILVSGLFLVLAAALPLLVKSVFGFGSIQGFVALDVMVFRVILVSLSVLSLFSRPILDRLKPFFLEESVKRDVTISVLILVFLFMVPELGFRGAGVIAPEGERTPFFKEFYDLNGAQNMYEEHQYLGVAPRSNFEGTGVMEGVSTNSHGFRGEELDIDNDTFVIAALGGSTTWGGKINNDSKTYPSQLEEMLKQEYPGRDFEVINAGVPGYTTAENVGNLHYRLTEYDPDMILLYNAYNDLKLNHEGCGGSYSCWRLKNDADRPLWSYSRFLSYVVETFASEIEKEDNITEEGLDSYRRNIRSIYGISQEYNATLVLSTMSHSVTPENVRENEDKLRNLRDNYLPRLSYQGMRRGMKYYNQEVVDFALENKEAYLVNNSKIPSNFEYHADHVHFTEKGARAQARNFKEVISSVIS